MAFTKQMLVCRSQCDGGVCRKLFNWFVVVVAPPPVTLMSNFTQFSLSTISHVFVMPFMLMLVDSTKLTPCPYSSCDTCIEACKYNPRSDGVSIDIWRSWSCHAKLQILQLGIPAPPWDSGICERLRLVFDDRCNLWRIDTRTALCS